MNYLDKIHKLCRPAYIYFIVSFFSIVTLIVQNLINGSKTKYCVGSFECAVPSTFLVFLFKFLYVLFWTVILDALCKYGYSKLAWFLVIFPFLLLAILIGLLILYSDKLKEMNHLNVNL